MKILSAEDDADKIKMRELNYATALNCVAVIVTKTQVATLVRRVGRLRAQGS